MQALLRIRLRLRSVQLANRPGFEEVKYQDIGDVLNRQPDELTTEGLQWKQKEEKKQMMMKIRKLLRDS
ncbi:hypothetical protein M514_05618 [Trichuris suis]|uniref:Uncharacterized protein n=1 Tax=Trichuris suis TaxID=68888 RepID=A0A085M8G6_9BILA|nr:hypothetical protein M513_05618 [Trichuris suis]KFD71817.1 hypothetical protein M514_05618 [Trichuris suis]